VKTASDVYAPISGTVKEVNEELEESPGLVNSSPDKDGWICKIDNIDIAEIEELMTESQYADFLTEND
jgi:glycine cleavage system H protein